MLVAFKRKISRQIGYIYNRRRIALVTQFWFSTLEYYDFFSFAFVFYYFSELFKSGLIMSYQLSLTVLVSFIFRPVGYRLFLKLRPLYNRNIIILGNGAVMTLAIISTGLIPTNIQHLWQVFVWLIIGRTLHGISFGFKLQANLRFIKETFPARIHRNIATSIIGAQFGLTCAAFLYKMIFTHLAPELLTWGWRLPFFIGGVMSLTLTIFRLFTYSSSNNLRKNDWAKREPLDVVVIKDCGQPALLGLFLASSRACFMFTLFVIIPCFLQWVMKWSIFRIANIMLCSSLLSGSVTWWCRRMEHYHYRLKQFLLSGLILALPLSILLCAGITYHNKSILLVSIWSCSILNGYLFSTIPLYMEQMLMPQHRLEALLFINNLEFFEFNLIRRAGVVLISALFGIVFEERHYAILLCISMLVTLIISIVVIIMDKFRKSKPIIYPV